MQTEQMSGTFDMIFILGAVFELVIALYQIITKKLVDKRRYDVYTEESIRRYAPLEGLSIVVSAGALILLVFSGADKPLGFWGMILAFVLLIGSVVILSQCGKRVLVKKDDAC